MERKNIVKEKSFGFAVKIISLSQSLIERKEFVLSKQLIRSGTAIGALIREAQNAESQRDFIHKLGISQKECDETSYWLELLKETGYISPQVYEKLSTEATELLRLLRSIIITSKRRMTA